MSTFPPHPLPIHPSLKDPVIPKATNNNKSPCSPRTGSICYAHTRFRTAWLHHGHTLDEIPWRSPLGVWGSYFGCFLVVICLIATFYISLYPVGGKALDAQGFFSNYLAAPIILALFLFWKVWTRDWSLGVRIRNIDVDTGRRYYANEPVAVGSDGVAGGGDGEKKGGAVMRGLRYVF